VTVTTTARVDHPPVRVGGAPIVLVAHGSRDPRSAETMRALAGAVNDRWSAGAQVAFLDFNPPSVPAALRAAGTGIVVPALLTRAYHSRVDVPEVVAASGVPSVVTPVLGPADPGQPADPLLLAGLLRRLSELDISAAPDALVLAAAGTSYTHARSTVEIVAAGLASNLDIACTVGYATTSAPTVDEAVRAMRAQGARRVAVAAYFLAPGRLYDLAAASAMAAGAIGVAAPFGPAEELVELVLERATAATHGIERSFNRESPVDTPGIR